MQDALSGEPTTLLRDFGITSGDVLWLLAPTVPEATAPAEMIAPAQSEPAVQDAPAAPQAVPTDDTGGDAAHANLAGGPVAEDQPLQTPPAPQYLPAHLHRVLNNSGLQHVPAEHALILAAHAAMLGKFSPSWAIAQPEGASAYCIPQSCWTSRSMFRLTYHLLSNNSVSGGSSMGSGIAGNSGASGPHTAQPETFGSAIKLQASLLGSGSILLAVSSDSHARHLSLSASAYVSPVQAATYTPTLGDQPGVCSSQAAGAAQAAPLAPVTPAHILPDGGVPLAGQLCIGPAQLRSLWTVLKDGLVLPMLLAVHAEAGLPPPIGLLALPTELELRVLQLLRVRCHMAAG
jgi:hypothetical protein